MASDVDIWRAAHLLITQQGKDAEFVAKRRAYESMEREDHEGGEFWLLIRRAVAELQAQPNEALH